MIILNVDSTLYRHIFEKLEPSVENFAKDILCMANYDDFSRFAKANGIGDFISKKEELIDRFFSVFDAMLKNYSPIVIFGVVADFFPKNMSSDAIYKWCKLYYWRLHYEENISVSRLSRSIINTTIIVITSKAFTFKPFNYNVGFKFIVESVFTMLAMSQVDATPIIMQYSNISEEDTKSMVDILNQQIAKEIEVQYLFELYSIFDAFGVAQGDVTVPSIEDVIENIINDTLDNSNLRSRIDINAVQDNFPEKDFEKYCTEVHNSKIFNDNLYIGGKVISRGKHNEILAPMIIAKKFDGRDYEEYGKEFKSQIKDLDESLDEFEEIMNDIDPLDEDYLEEMFNNDSEDWEEDNFENEEEYDFGDDEEDFESWNGDNFEDYGYDFESENDNDNEEDFYSEIFLDKDSKEKAYYQDCPYPVIKKYWYLQKFPVVQAVNNLEIEYEILKMGETEAYSRLMSPRYIDDFGNMYVNIKLSDELINIDQIKPIRIK